MCHPRSAGPEGRPRAVAAGGQPAAPGALAAVGPLRQRQRVRGRLAGHARGRPRPAERIAPRPRARPLRQSGALGLAVPALAPPGGRHGGRGRRGVATDDAPLQGVDAPHGLREGACNRAPAGSDAESIEERRQPSLGEVARADHAADAPPAGARMGFDPRLDARAPMGTRGEHTGQPHHGRPAATHSLPRAMGRAGGVQDCGHAHVLEGRDDGRYGVYAFVGCCDFLAHPTR